MLVVKSDLQDTKKGSNGGSVSGAAPGIIPIRKPRNDALGGASRLPAFQTFFCSTPLFHPSTVSISA